MSDRVKKLSSIKRARKGREGRENEKSGMRCDSSSQEEKTMQLHN